MTPTILLPQLMMEYYKFNLSKKPHNMSTISISSFSGYLSILSYFIKMEPNNLKLNFFSNFIRNSTLTILSNKKNSKPTDSTVKQIKASCKHIIFIYKILWAKKNTTLSYLKRNNPSIFNNSKNFQIPNPIIIMMTLNSSI